MKKPRDSRIVQLAIMLCLAVAVLAGPAPDLRADPPDASVVSLLKRSFFYGREYFVLRSGRVQMIVEADKADLAPAVLFLLFDARDIRQNEVKDKAINFGGGAGFVRSALEVVLGGFPFTAVGHETETRWTIVEGIPAVEAVWWAGGLRVTERIFALAERGAFVRRIELAGVNLAATERATLRLSLPPGDCTARDGLLIQKAGKSGLAVGAVDEQPSRAVPEKGVLEIGALEIAPGRRVCVDTLLLAGMFDADGPAAWPPASLVKAELVAALEQTRRQWAAASSLRTDDAVVQELFDKVRFALPGMIADNGVMDAGIFEYGGQWVRDTSNTLLGMVHAGHFELARQGFENILKNMITADGRTMICGSFDTPDREQFDQMGELMHALRAYRDWTGDDSLVREHRAKLVAMVERPLRPEFRDATGMVHNRREYWERVWDDGYELAYQTYVVLGLRDAAELAGPLGAEDRAPRWRAEADRTLHAMLAHPSRALVAEGRLIKRRNTDGRWVRHVPGWGSPDTPGRTEQAHRAEPDAATALPIALGLVDARGPLARNTLDELDSLWNARWFGGGYERYHSSAQGDQPGPWSFASCFILRAQHEAELWDRSRRTLDWLNRVPGGRAGAWFEEIPLVRSWAAKSGIVPWTSGEISLFVVRHLLGVRFERGALVIRPALYPDSPAVEADLRFRKARLKLRITGAGAVQYAEVNGRRIEPDAAGAIRLPPEFEGGSVVIYAAGKRH
jgi:hypothetical protein